MNLSSLKNLPNFNIVFVIDSLEVGGAESQLVMLASELHNRGYHCEVFALRAEGTFLDTLEMQGIPVNSGGFSKTKDRIAMLKGIWYLWHCIRKNRPCVVHTYLPLSNFIGSIVARVAGASVVITSRRGLGKHQDKESRWKYFDRISNTLSTKITVNSLAVAKDTIHRDGVDNKKIACIYNGLDFSRFDLPANLRELMRNKLGLSQSDFAWVKVANLVDYKGHVDLIQAFVKLPKNNTTRLFLVGRDRGVLSELKVMVETLGVADRVAFLGDRRDVPELLTAMDGFVMASHTEGFSNAILEAMATGLPIVATTVGGNAEALQDGELGMLVESHNPMALANAMLVMMKNEKLRIELSRVAKQTIQEKYSIVAMVASYLQLYNHRLVR